MKNYTKEGQKLPIFGIGPYLICTLGLLTLVGIILSGNVLSSGVLKGACVWISRVAGVALIILGFAIWFIGAVRSDMDECIKENKLKTDGIYAWVRNPMYSGWWILISGISLIWHNAWLLIIPVINWVIMSIVLINTEEKWLFDLYGTEYEEYKKQVNRCIPWIPKKRKK